MMNAPARKLAELEALLPGLESPSVIPLAHDGMIAIHSVVGADEVWGLLPRLKARRRVRDPRAPDREDPPVTAATPPPAPPAAGPADSRRRRPSADRDALFRRGAVPDPAVRDAARAILADVRERGAAAVRDARPRVRRRPARRPPAPRAPTSWRGGRDPSRPPSATRSRPRSPTSRRFAETQLPAGDAGRRSSTGVELERRWLPVARAGVYAPGGSAPYPCSLVMGVVPARVAGVGTVVVASPADATGPSTRSCSARPACWASTPCSSRAASRRSARSPTACRTRASRPSTSSSAPAARGSPPRRSSSSARWRSTSRPARPRASCSPTRRRPRDGRRRPHHPGRARPGLPRPARDAERGPRRRGRGRGPRAASPPRSRRDILARRARRPRPDRPRPGHRRRHRLRQRLRARAPVGRRRGPRGRRRADPQRRLHLRRPLVARSRAGDYASGANHVLPTGGLARGCGPLAVETFGKLQPGPADHARGPRRAPARDPDPRRGRGPARPPRRGRGPLRRETAPGGAADEPEPVRRLLAHRPGLVQLGGDRRGRRRAVRDPGGAGPAVRPQHLPRPAGDARGDARRGPVRDAPVRVPARRLPAPRRGRRRTRTAWTRRARPGRGRRRDPRHVHQGVPARRAGAP